METLATFYRSKRWQKLREQIMNERTGADGFIICEKCGKAILKRYDCIAHHKTELTEENVNDMTVSLNPDNIELIHFRCHNIEHGRFEGFRQEVYLVYGAPCSGKTSWVRENADEDDLIIDIDAIWESICKADRYHKPKRLRANVFGVRDLLIDQVRTRTGKWRRAFVIGTYPLQTDRERICDALRATPVFIDEDEATCISRAKTEEWREYVRRWFEDFIPDAPAS